MKSCRLEKYICVGLVLAMVLSGMCFANDKADSVSAYKFLTVCGENDTAEIYDISEVSNLHMLKSANTASVVRENKRLLVKRDNRLSIVTLFVDKLCVCDGSDFATENYVVFDESVGRTMIVKFIQRQDGKKSNTLII